MASPMTPDSPTDPAARADLLRRLPRDGFVPAGDAPWARDPLAAEVEAFAAAYWELAPRERRARWTDLHARGAGRPGARLVELAAGLAVTPRPTTDRYATAVAGVLRELFTLPPRARAARRRAWLAGLAGPLGLWAVAAREFAQADPATARLDPLLVHRLREGLVPVPVGPLDPDAVGPDVLAGLLWDEQRHARERTEARRRRTDRWVALGVVSFVGPFVVLIATGLKLKPPVPPPPKVAAPPPVLTPAQIDAALGRARGGTVSTLFRTLSGGAPGTGMGPVPRPAPTRR
ncbi:hypothetical protein J0H58_34775 [bacterium]|nr:hypothetical protein [bacterium]